MILYSSVQCCDADEITCCRRLPINTQLTRLSSPTNIYILLYLILIHAAALSLLPKNVGKRSGNTPKESPYLFYSST